MADPLDKIHRHLQPLQAEEIARLRAALEMARGAMRINKKAADQYEAERDAARAESAALREDLDASQRALAAEIASAAERVERLTKERDELDSRWSAEVRHANEWSRRAHAAEATVETLRGALKAVHARLDDGLVYIEQGTPSAAAKVIRDARAALSTLAAPQTKEEP